MHLIMTNHHINVTTGIFVVKGSVNSFSISHAPHPHSEAALTMAIHRLPGRQLNLPTEYSAGLLARGVTDGTYSYSVTSTVPFTQFGIFLTGVNSLI